MRYVWVSLFFCWSSWLLSNTAQGQHLPAWYPPQVQYVQALDLYDHEKYEAAQQKFEHYLQLAQQYPLGRAAGNARLALARYYRAMCAYHMLKYGAESLLLAFIDQHPEHPKAGWARYYRGKLFFIKRKYDDALAELELVSGYPLSRTAQQDVEFMKGYGYFRQDRREEAAKTLQPLTQYTGPYHDRANYYYGLVQYDRGQLNDALEAFMDIKDSEAYRLLVPVFISGILHQQEQYDKLKTFGRELLREDLNYDQKPLIYQQIGSATYYLKDYAQAQKFLEAGEQATNTPSRPLQYYLGLTHFHQDHFRQAKPYLETVAEGNDTLAQGAAYYLGFTLLELGQPEDARFAFRRAASLEQQQDFTRDGLLQYGKLSFETKFFNDAVSALKDYLLQYPQADNADEVQGLIGEALYYSNNFSAALEYFNKSRLRDDRTKEAYQKTCLYYGLQLFEHNKLDSAEYFLQKAADMQTTRELFMTSNFWYGEILYVKGRYLEAARAYNAFVKTPGAKNHPNYAQGLIGLGWAHLLQEHRESAEQSFRIAANLPNLEEKDPMAFEEASLRWGDVLFLKKEYARALRYYQRALGVSGGQNPDYALYQSGITNFRRQRYEPGVKLLKRIVASYRNSPLRDEALLQMAETYFTWLKDNANAKAYAHQLIDQHPNSPLVPEAYLVLGQAAENSGNTPQAVKHYKTVLNDYPNATNEGGKAIDFLCELVPPEECSEYLDAYRQRNPEANARLELVAFNAARDLFYEDKISAALQQLNAYLSDYPNGENYYPALLLRGKAHEKLDQFERAMEDFEKVYNAPDAGESKAPALLEAAAIADRKGRSPEALELYTRAEEAASVQIDRLKARLARGRLLLELERPREARQLMRETITDQATTTYSRIRARVLLGRAFYQAEMPDSALKTFRKVAEENANVQGAESQYFVVRIHYEQGRPDSAMQGVYYMKDQFRPYAQWLAKAFLIVAEIYVDQGKRLNAMETLKSLIQNAPNEEIKATARQRLEEVRALVEEDQTPETSPTPNNPPPPIEGEEEGEDLEDTYIPEE